MANGRIDIEVTGPNTEQFHIESFLSGGAFGEVYKAVGLKSGTPVAVKMVPEQKLNDPQTLAVKTVLNETRMEMLKVTHPNVVRVLFVDTGSEPAIGPYVMMEFIAGGNLQHLIDGRRIQSTEFTIDKALSLMRSIALGTQAINEDVIGLDVAMDQVFIDGPVDAPRPRIADFGIARIASEYTRPETFKGIQMLWYKAPEVWRQERNTYKIDIYSTGLVFYQILTLEHPLMQFVPQPYDFDRWREVHLTVPCPDVHDKRTDVPLALAKLLLRMVDKSPGNRPSWDEVISGLSTKPSPPASLAQLDLQLLAVVKNQANERFREEQARTAAALKHEQELERNAARGDEFRQSSLRLLAGFDAIIAAINEHETTYPIQIKGEGTLSRSYILSNGRTLVCEIFGTAPGRPPRGTVLGGGFIGVDGGLSANLILQGQPDDIASAYWSAVEATVMALIGGNNRLKWYREAGISDDTIRYAEFMNGNEPWRRDSPSYFGFRKAVAFFEHFSYTGMHVYQFQIVLDLDRIFNEILMLGIRMPPTKVGIR
jgi:serine/threonine protein kinase